MLLSLAVWLYVTLLCFAWGHCLLGLVKKWWPGTDTVLFPLVCFTGLLFIGVCCTWASLILPLGAVVHGLILAVALAWYGFRRHRQLLRRSLQAMVSNTSKPVIILFLLCCLLVLLIGTHTIHHPDTLAYHTQAILWMEQYKAVPGLVHLDHVTAMGNTWFGLQAIFRFGFLYHNPWLFVNGCVLCWFFLFVCHHLNAAREQAAKGLAWWLLLVFSLVSWTAIRLTAASASPDFIATLCLWAAFYSALQYRQDQPGISAHLFLALFFSIVAVTIKLSAIMILLIPVLLFVMALTNRRAPWAISIIAIGVLALVPYCARNVISAGYPLFPSHVLNIFDVDWKLPFKDVVTIQHYITAYARYPVTGYEAGEAAYALPFASWAPQWWRNLAIEEQVFIAVIVILLVYNFFTLREQTRHRSRNENILLLVALVGSIFWFYKAPAFRFGTGFLVSLVYFLSRGVLPSFPKKGQQWYRKIMPGLIIGTGVVIAGYCGWRVLKFFTPSQILVPRGVQAIPYQKIECQGTTFYRTQEDDHCGFIPLPCALDSCQGFQLRGKEITEGFKAKAPASAPDSAH